MAGYEITKQDVNSELGNAARSALTAWVNLGRVATRMNALDADQLTAMGFTEEEIDEVGQFVAGVVQFGAIVNGQATLDDTVNFTALIEPFAGFY